MNEPKLTLKVNFGDDPKGIRTVTDFNWTGHVLISPLAQIDKALDRLEGKGAGVYILLGEKDGKKTAYVGKAARQISSRLRGHKKKDWWKEAIVVTTTNGSLEPTHVEYLEACLYEKVKEAGKVNLGNEQEPSHPNISENRTHDMKEFLRRFLQILPFLNVDLGISRAPSKKSPSRQKDANASPTFILVSKWGDRYNARAVQEGQDFVVQAGSLARGKWEGSKLHGKKSQKIRDELVKEGVLVRDGENLRFTKDYRFKKMGAIAGVITGRHAADTVEWRVEGTDQTLRDYRKKPRG